MLTMPIKNITNCANCAERERGYILRRLEINREIHIWSQNCSSVPNKSNFTVYFLWLCMVIIVLCSNCILHG